MLQQLDQDAAGGRGGGVDSDAGAGPVSLDII